MPHLYSDQTLIAKKKRLSGAHQLVTPSMGSAKTRLSIGEFTWTSSLTDENGAPVAQPVPGDTISLVSIPGDCRLLRLEMTWNGQLVPTSSGLITSINIPEYEYRGDDGNTATQVSIPFNTVLASGTPGSGGNIGLLGSTYKAEFLPARLDGEPLEIIGTVQSTAIGAAAPVWAADVRLRTIAEFLVE